MQVTETLSDGLRRSYAVRVPAAEIESRARARLADIGKTLRLPGFRPGKVPPNLVRQRFGGSVMAEVMQEAVNGIAERVVSEQKLRPAGQPRVSLEGTPRIDATAPQDLDIKVDVELLPDITLPDLAAISLTRLRAEPSEATVDEAMASIATRNRRLEDIEEIRPAAVGDVLLLDFVGRIDGEPFADNSATDATIEVGGAGFIPGFTEQLEGMSPGETRTIDVTFPDTYAVAAVAGRAAKFDITAKALKRWVTPALDDALATTLGVESAAKLRTVVTEQIQREYDQQARLRLKRELLDVLAEGARFPSPSGLLEAEFAGIWQRVEADRRDGRIDDEDRDKDDATLRAEYRAIADRRVRLGLLLAEIGRVRDVIVTQAELTQALRAEAMRFPGQERQVIEFFQKNEGAIQQLRGPIFEDKVVDQILAEVQLTEKLVPPEDLALPDTEPAPRIAADLSEQSDAAPSGEESVEAASPEAVSPEAAPAAAAPIEAAPIEAAPTEAAPIDAASELSAEVAGESEQAGEAETAA